MTISITKSRTTKTGDGSTTVFNISDSGQGIYFSAASEINVQLRVANALTAQSQGTHYSVAGAGTASGTVTFVTAPADGTKIDIWRTTPRTQELSLAAGGSALPSSIEAMADKFTRIIQEIEDTGGGGGSGFDDDHVMTLFPAGTAWDGESHRIARVADGVAEDDAATVGQLAQYAQNAIALIKSQDAEISDSIHFVMVNTDPATITIAEDTTNCMISRSSASTADVTVVPPAGYTIAGNADGVIINEAIGPIFFRPGSDDPTDYVYVIPSTLSSGGSTSGASSYSISKTVAELGDLTPTAGVSYFASDGRKTGEGVGAGTGVQVFGDGSDWVSVQGGTVAA